MALHAAEQLNEYEQQRLERIRQNRAKLTALGFADHAADEACDSHAAHTGQKRCVKKRVAPAQELLPSRVSKRLKGEQLQAEIPSQSAHALTGDEAAPEGKAARAKPKLTLDATQTVVAPFTLRAIGTTVWELGEVYRGPWSQNYWSSSGCLFHHAYPIGFRACKVMFDGNFEMKIAAGDIHPSFQVTNLASRQTFTGASPTSPWTSVCLAQRTGQRISGPLFFGFSDLTTQRAIAAMYNEREMTAALQLERLGSAAPLPAEVAARQFRELEGIGEGTATVMALSTAMGGYQHGSLASLRAWAQQDGGVELALFLLTSSEMPEATRRWPAWRSRIVPKIVAAICGSSAAACDFVPQQQQQQQPPHSPLSEVQPSSSDVHLYQRPGRRAGTPLQCQGQQRRDCSRRSAEQQLAANGEAQQPAQEEHPPSGLQRRSAAMRKADCMVTSGLHMSEGKHEFVVPAGAGRSSTRARKASSKLAGFTLL